MTRSGRWRQAGYGRLRSFVARSRTPFPKLARSFDFAVVARARDIVCVVPLVIAAMSRAIVAFVSQAEVDEKPGQVSPKASAPSERIGLDDHVAPASLKAAILDRPVVAAS
jgi:hypothetical protein